MQQSKGSIKYRRHMTVHVEGHICNSVYKNIDFRTMIEYNYV